MATGREVLRDVAPAASSSLLTVEASLWADAGELACTGLVELTARTTAAVHGLSPLIPPTGQMEARNRSVPSTELRSPADPTVSASAVTVFAAQFATDVSAITPEQRAAFVEATGPAAGTLAGGLWVVDLIPRVHTALDLLFTSGHWPGSEPAAADPGGVWSAIDGVIRTFPALDALDPVTSELIRLRVARAHDCRLCRSLRNRDALRAGADETTFDDLDHYEDGRLGVKATAALALCDAMIWAPGRISPQVIDAARNFLTPAEQVEVVLDVARNSLNKVAVALGADAPHVTEGVELYEIAPDGTLNYGLSLD